MNIDRYQLKADEDLVLFEFVSVGPKGSIVKVVQFTPTSTNGIYNLALGDKNSSTGEIDYQVISDNQDRDKILATVVSSVYEFTNRNRDAWVFAEGNTKIRTRLYRIGIAKYLKQASYDFFILGQINDEWEPFAIGRDYDAFVVRRKIT